MTLADQQPMQLSVQPSLARRQLSELLAETHWSGDADAVVLAAHEALVNAEHHAGGVTAATADLDGNAVVVEVCDRGRGFRLPSDRQAPDAVSERGRGLWLMSQLATRSEVRSSGGEVCVCLRFEADITA